MLEGIIRSLVYYPVRIPRDAELPPYVRGAEEAWVKSRDGNEIHGLYWPPPPGRPTLLFFHGNAESVFQWALIREELAATECGLFLIDYPGYGKSTGSPSEAGLYAAGQATYDWLCQEKETPPDRIILFGKSLGGGVVSEVACNNPVGGIILESTFTSLPTIARKLFPILPVGIVFKTEKYETLERIGRLRVPVLIVHGNNDEMIPVQEARALYEAANEPKQLYLVPRAGHNDVSMVAGSTYGETLRTWLDALTSGG